MDVVYQTKWSLPKHSFLCPYGSLWISIYQGSNECLLVKGRPNDSFKRYSLKTLWSLSNSYNDPRPLVLLNTLLFSGQTPMHIKTIFKSGQCLWFEVEEILPISSSRLC